MKINLSNFETSDVSLFDVSIVQRDVGGGKTEKEDIDCLEEYPTAKSLIISGLNQECFEYLIKHYGSQFEAISFWKNKSVSDLSPLEDLTNVKFIHFFFNQKATDLWNMERNEKLSGLSIYDFSRITFGCKSCYRTIFELFFHRKSCLAQNGNREPKAFNS